MERKQMENGNLKSNISGMSTNQLYDIMSQMKTLIEQNPDQARQILIDSPEMTRSLFQAQILLGMVKPPEGMPSNQQALSQDPHESVNPVQPPSGQAKELPTQVSQQEASQAQIQIPARKQQPNHSVSSVPSTAVLPLTHQSQTMPSYSQESMQPAMERKSTHEPSISHQQSSQVHTMLPHQFRSAQQPPSFHQTQKPNLSNQSPNMSNQSQQSLHSPSAQYHSQQPPLPSQPRPPSMQPFQHQHYSQMGPHAGFQTSAPSQSHISHQQFIGNRHPASIGFPPAQQLIPTQPPVQSLYQGGSHLSANFNHQGGSSNMQMDNSWRPGPPESSMGRSQLPGQPPLPGQMDSGNQNPHPSQLGPEMKQVLLQQVMSLTPEQINLLPPEQRNQVLHLQQMLR